jgi:hypothetical protein
MLVEDLNQLAALETPPQRLMPIRHKALYHLSTKKSVEHYKYKGSLIEMRLPGSDITRHLLDTEGLIDVSNPECEVVLRKINDNFGDTELRQIIKTEKKTGIQLYYPLASLNPRTFFNKIDWQECLSYWVNGGSEKDTRLVEAFKTCIIPLPSSNPIEYQPLNAHQIWVTNSGTGKSTFNLIYGNTPIQELTQAGLFGSNDNKYESQLSGMLSGGGMFMIDEVSELTVSNKDHAPLINLMLSYLEQGSVTRAFKKAVTCKGTKTIILNSNPKANNNPAEGILHFIRTIGSDDDKVRLGRRFGLFLFGNDFQQVDLSKPFPTHHIAFIQRVIRTSIAKSIKPIYKLYCTHYPEISTPDRENQKELIDIAEHAIIPDIADLLKGISLATSKIKTAAFRTCLLENLDLLVLGKTSEVSKLWKSNKSEYIARLHAINRQSFKTLEEVLLTLDERESIKFLRSTGLTQKEIGETMGKSQQAISKAFQKLK